MNSKIIYSNKIILWESLIKNIFQLTYMFSKLIQKLIICLKNGCVYLKDKSSNGKIDNNFKNINVLDSRIIIKYDSKYYPTILLKSIKYLIIFLVFSLIYLLYFLSLEKCDEGLEKCSLKLSWIESIIKKEIISCILLAIMLQLIFLKIISKKNIIHIAIILAIFFLYLYIITFVFLYFCIFFREELRWLAKRIK